MAGILVSQLVADGYGARIVGIFERRKRPLTLIVSMPDTVASAEARKNLEIAFYSRDVWEG
ncbi:MAG TPA: hypothetical protein VGO08_16010, partial [Burkholderiales bacterium]|nr:hypothetical protein [Burkholderiales bacterium]